MQQWTIQHAWTHKLICTHTSPPQAAEWSEGEDQAEIFKSSTWLHGSETRAPVTSNIRVLRWGVSEWYWESQYGTSERTQSWRQKWVLREQRRDASVLLPGWTVHVGVHTWEGQAHTRGSEEKMSWCNGDRSEEMWMKSSLAWAVRRPDAVAWDDKYCSRGYEWRDGGDWEGLQGWEGTERLLCQWSRADGIVVSLGVHL